MEESRSSTDVPADRSRLCWRPIVLVLSATVVVSVGWPQAWKLNHPQGRKLLRWTVGSEVARAVNKSELTFKSKSTFKSEFTCVGEDVNTRRCVVHNAVYRGGQFWVVGSSDPFPAVLCSGVNAPEAYRHECIVNVVAESELPEYTGAIDMGVAWSRLNPTNPYHALCEDMVPVYAMLLEDGEVPVQPSAALRRLGEVSMGLMLTDGLGKQLDDTFWRALLPEVKVLQPSSDEAVLVRRLVMGSRGECVHWGHCIAPPGLEPAFRPQSAAMALRALALARMGIDDRLEVPASTSTRPRVTVVQRSSTRVISNLEDVVRALKEDMQVEPQVVDFKDMPVERQVAVAHNTDIMVMVHGGALANLVWLPFAALVVDVYPYMFAIESHSSLVHWMRRALMPLELGHHPFQVSNSSGQVADGRPLRPDCTCRGDASCQAQLFWHTDEVRVDVEAFREHMRLGIEQWRNHRYQLPSTRENFLAAEKPQEKDEHSRPLCWP